MKRVLLLFAIVLGMTTMAFAEKNVLLNEAPHAAASSTCKAKVIIIDSNGKRAYKPTIHVEFHTGSFSSSYKKFYGDSDGVVEVTWDDSSWGSSVKCSMTIGTGTMTTTWTKSTSKFTMSDGGTYTFDVREVGY